MSGARRAATAVRLSVGVEIRGQLMLGEAAVYVGNDVMAPDAACVSGVEPVGGYSCAVVRRADVAVLMGAGDAWCGVKRGAVAGC